MIVCADDYGMREDVDRAILELAEAGRLSAASCMVGFGRCNTEVMGRLLAFQGQMDIGLHLCLTDEGPDWFAGTKGGFLPYGVLVRRALTGRVQAQNVAGLAAAQYELFVKKSGRRPDYLDGHLHAHQLPGVRDGVLEFVRSLPKPERPYVRNTRLATRELRRRRLPWVKAAFIGAFGNAMERDLHTAGIATNDGFAGIYDFAQWQAYPDYFPRFVDCLRTQNGMLVVHPGGEEAWRTQELNVLRQFAFTPGQLNRFQRA